MHSPQPKKKNQKVFCANPIGQGSNIDRRRLHEILASGSFSAHDAVQTPKCRAGTPTLDAAERPPNHPLSLHALFEVGCRF
jgi:hypothetical protein